MVLAILRCFKYTRLFHYRLRQALQGVRNLAGNGVAASCFIYNGHDLCCHPEFYRKFRLKQIRGKPLSRAYTSAPFARVSTVVYYVETYRYRYRLIITIHISSCILIRYRFPNERLSTTICTIGLPRLAR